MKLYREILNDKGIIHLKTDSSFMYTYTCEMLKVNHFPVLVQTDDLYHCGLADEILSIQTFYEQQWLDRGLNIKFLKFICEPREQYIEPEVEIELDAYRSFNRSKRSRNQKKN
jgi:tRNA (guanine-N7-)-methyltransferase